MAGRIENLKNFPKGVSGNPNGRPKKLPALDKLLDEVLGSESNGKTAAEQILRAVLAKAKKGDIRAAEIIFDRAYGKPKQSVDLTTNGERIHTTVIFQRARDRDPGLLDGSSNGHNGKPATG